MVISKKRILMYTGYAGALALASIAFMLITGIMGYKITVTIIAAVTVEDVEEAKAKGKGRSTIYDDAIPIDDSILTRFPRSDEFKKALEELGEFKRTCKPNGGLYGLVQDCNASHQFGVNRFEAFFIKYMLNELASKHNKKPEYNSAIVKYKDVYYLILLGE